MTAEELSGLRVLVVEDDGLVSLLIEDYLSELGCEVVACASRLDEALIMAGSANVNAAVLDVNLAGQLSYPVGRLLAERKIPFVFATGYGALAVPHELQSVPVLCKPYGKDELARALRTLST